MDKKLYKILFYLKSNNVNSCLKAWKELKWYLDFYSIIKWT